MISNSITFNKDEQISELQQKIINQQLEMAEEIHSPRSGAVFRGYIDRLGVKQAWGT